MACLIIGFMPDTAFMLFLSYRQQHKLQESLILDSCNPYDYLFLILRILRVKRFEYSIPNGQIETEICIGFSLNDRVMDVVHIGGNNSKLEKSVDTVWNCDV